MLDYYIALALLFELSALILIIRLLVPIRRFPGVRIFLGLGAVTGGVLMAEIFRLVGFLYFYQPLQVALTVLLGLVAPVLGLALVLDLQGESLQKQPRQLPRHMGSLWQAWSSLGLSHKIFFCLALLALPAGFLFSGYPAGRLIVWLFGSSVFLSSVVRFVRAYRQALTRYRALINLNAALLLTAGLLWVVGLWGIDWASIGLVFIGILILAGGVVFLRQKAIILRLGNAERSQTEGALEGWFVLDPAGRILDFGGNALRLLNRLRGGVVGQTIHTLFPQVGNTLAQIEANRRLDMDVEDDFFGAARLCRLSLYFPIQTRTIFEPRVLRIRALPSFERDSLGQSAAEKKYADLLHQKTLLQTALDAFPQGIMITDSAGKVLYRNQILIEMLDLSDQALLVDDTEWDETFSRRMKDPDRFINFMQQILNQTVGETLDILECSDGRLLECRTRFYYVDSLGCGCKLWSFLDCTEQQRRERELLHMGMHDTLTGIYNRAFFELKLRQLRLVDLYPVCMYMIDVDGLKYVNDNQGHTTGDQLLKQAAYVLRQACRTDDIVARLGGDEFGMLLVHADQQIAEQISTRIHGLVNMHNIRHPDIQVSISMGYAIAENAKEMESLFSRADDAMYEARRKVRAGQGALPV